MRAKVQWRETNEVGESLEAPSEQSPHRDVSRNPNGNAAREVFGTLLSYVALPVFLFGVFALMYSAFFWVKAGDWKNITVLELMQGTDACHPNWAVVDYVFTQAHVALPTAELAVILFVACSLLFAD